MNKRFYENDKVIVKLYGYGEHKKLQIVYMNLLRSKGYEADNKRISTDTVNDSKLQNNICRARNKIFELAFCNPWDWFFTRTLDPTKYDRSDLTKFHKDLTQFITNYNRIHNTSIKYLLIPELHSDGHSWHMHGFLYGLPISHLNQFKIGDRMGKKLAEKVKKGDAVYNWGRYAAKFGFCDLEPIKNSEAASKYVTKYVNKNLETSVTELGRHMYYHSRGLNEAETIKIGSVCGDTDPIFKDAYCNEYCKIAWFNYDDNRLNSILSLIV